MSRFNPKRNLGPLLEAAAHWIQRSLIDEQSLFADKELWTSGHLEEVRAAFTGNPDASDASFFEKLEGQMSAASAGAKRLMAELLWVLMLFQSNIGPPKKRESISRVWAWSGTTLDLSHPLLADVVLTGVGNPGTAYNTMRWRELNYLIGLAIDLAACSREERQSILLDRDRFESWIENAPQEGYRQFRHLFRYLAFPDQNERITLNRDRRLILEAFTELDSATIRDMPDAAQDDQLNKLRSELKSKLGRANLDYYEPDIAATWRVDKKLSPDVQRAGADKMFDLGYAALRERFLAHMPGFKDFQSHPGYAGERSYKDELRALYKQTVLPAFAEGDLRAAGAAAIALLTIPLKAGANKPQNIVGWRYVDLLRKSNESQQLAFGRALAGLLNEEEALEQRVNRFVNELQQVAGPGNAVPAAAQRSIAGFYLALNDAKRHLFLKTQETQRALRQLDRAFQWSSKQLTGSDVARVEFLANRVFQKLSSEGWAPRDLLDVQGFLWVAVGYDEARIEEPAEDEDEEEILQMAQSPDTGQKPINRVLYGPPGTGKTRQLLKYFEDYVDQPADIDAATWGLQLVGRFGWRAAIAAALGDLSHPVRVADLEAHPLLKLKAAQRKGASNIKATLWGYMQEHTSPASQTVNVTTRRPPYVFDKTSNAEWYVVSDWKEVDPQAAELLSAWKAGPGSSGTPINRYRVVTFHPSYSYEDFVIGLRPVILEDSSENGATGFRMVDGVFKQICSEARANPGKRYALFIDEINRANIAKVFGELITLIEPDKRARYDADGRLVGGMEVQLPGTGGEEGEQERFGVPANLDIYGTMNTADRSIALLDIALRRRFEFEEMPPNYEALDDAVEGVHLGRLLLAINDRLEFLADRDRRIGHAYFTQVQSLDDLRKSFGRQIIPLLQEYFFDDWGQVALVLTSRSGQSPFVKRESLDGALLFGNAGDLAQSERHRYQITSPTEWTAEAFQSLYQSAAE